MASITQNRKDGTESRRRMGKGSTGGISEEIVRGGNQMVIALSATPRRALEQINCPFNHITIDHW